MPCPQGPDFFPVPYHVILLAVSKYLDVSPTVYLPRETGEGDGSLSLVFLERRRRTVPFLLCLFGKETENRPLLFYKWRYFSAASRSILPRKIIRLLTRMSMKAMQMTAGATMGLVPSVIGMICSRLISTSKAG